MNKQQQLFDRLQFLGTKVSNLSGIVQNESGVTYEDLEDFDRHLHCAIRDLQDTRMELIMYFKNNNLIQP